MWTAPIPDKQFDLEISFLVKQEAARTRSSTAASRVHGTARTAEVLDRIKAQGFKYSTRSGHDRCRCAMRSSRRRRTSIIAEADKQVLRYPPTVSTVVSFPTMNVTSVVIKTWNEATEKVA